MQGAERLRKLSVIAEVAPLALLTPAIALSGDNMNYKEAYYVITAYAEEAHDQLRYKRKGKDSLAAGMIPLYKAIKVYEQWLLNKEKLDAQLSELHEELNKE